VRACERYLNAIQELVDGTLGPIRRAELELHLESCDACRALADDLQAIASAAESLDPLTPPERVWAQVAGRLRTEGRVSGTSPTTARRHSVAILALAAALFGYMHLSSCRRAEKNYRAAVDRRLKLVCG